MKRDDLDPVDQAIWDRTRSAAPGRNGDHPDDDPFAGLDVMPDVAALRTVKSLEVALTECVATFHRWLELPDDDVVHVVLGAVAANLTAGDPLWMLVVGPPGSGKTEAIDPLCGLG